MYKVEDLYTLWAETLKVVGYRKVETFDMIDDSVKEKVVKAFEKVNTMVPEEVIPTYFVFVIKLCKRIKVFPTYKFVGSDKNISSFLKTRNISVISNRRKFLNKEVSKDQDNSTLNEFIKDVKKIKQALHCDNTSAVVIAMSKYKWKDEDVIRRFITLVNQNVPSVIKMLQV